MGVRKRKKHRTGDSQTPIGVQPPKSEGHKPSSIFEGGPGRPTPRKDYLFCQREALIFRIEPLWWKIGFTLSCARDPEDIRKVFDVIDLRSNPGPLAPVLRATSEPSTSATIMRTRDVLENAVEKLRTIDCEHQKQLRSHEDVARAVYTLSEKFKQDLEKELARRRQNIRGIKIQITDKRARIRRAQLRHKLDREGVLESGEPNANKRGNGLQGLEKDCAADDQVCQDLENRIRLITPDRRNIVTEEEARQKQLLNSLEQQLKNADTEVRKLENKLQDQEAFFFQAEILKFVRKKRYALTPRNLANAIAGLPFLTSRRSAELCAKLRSRVVLSRDYSVFLFVESAWNRRDKRGRLPLVEWFKRQVERLPKFQLINGERMGNPFRTYLAENWYYLKQAVGESQRLKLVARGMPHVITGAFLRYSRAPETQAESILAQKEKIKV